MKTQRPSLYITLGLIIFLTVTIVMSISSTLTYMDTKENIIDGMKKSSTTTILSIKENISDMVASYSVNEYEKIIKNEIEKRDITALIIKDYNMGEIIGDNEYVSGEIKVDKKIVEYELNNKVHNKILKKSYFSNTYDIKSQDKKIGEISIYISNEKLNNELNKIVYHSIKKTLYISFLLIVFLFFFIKHFILNPIYQIVEVINDGDEDGLPLKEIPSSKTKEINILSNSMNKMIGSIKYSRYILQESEQRLKYLLESSPIAVRIAKNRGEDVVFANKAYSKLLNLDKKEDSFNKNPKDYYVDPKDYEEVVSSLDEKGSIYNKLAKLSIKGKTVWVLSSYMKIDFNGEKSVIGWFFDVTKEKKNEVKLFEALELQTTIFDNSGYLFIRTDKNGIIKQINKETEKLLGYTSEELVDKKTPEIIHLKSECELRVEEFSKELKRPMSLGFELFVAKSNMGLKNEHEWTYVTKDGKYIPVFLAVSALKNKNNEVYGYLGIAKDITERKLVESQAKLASMGEMIGNIAHQWRQPLNVISTIASGIKLRSEFGILELQDVLEEMDGVMKQAQYLSDTIDDFRNFIKNTNNKDNTSISNTVKKALTILDSAMINNNIELIVDIEEDLEIEAYTNQLIQVIINIINNAKDAINTEDLEEKIIFVSTKKSDNGIILNIKDNGGGIKEDIISRIFEPYFTTKHQSIGTGIGLSMAHQIITKHHNATIEVHNENYEYKNENYTGASFSIEFKM